MKNDYQYALMLCREGPTALGQVSPKIDWEPAREWTAFGALRHGQLLPDETISEGVVQPLWHSRLGEPYIEGFRVTLEARHAQQVTADFTKAYFNELAKRAASLLIQQGVLQKGESFKFLVMAYPRPEQKQAESKLLFTTEDAGTDLTVTDAALAEFASRGTLQGTVHVDDMPLYVPQRVLTEAVALSKMAGAKETGGILIGRLVRDVSVPEVFAEVTAQIPALHTKATLTSLTFTADTWTDVRAALDLRRKGEVMLGWWHSHPVREWCKACTVESQKECAMSHDFFSEHDRALHRTIFPRAYSVGLVVNDQAGDDATFSMFGWRRGLIEARGFHVVEVTPVAGPTLVNDVEASLAIV